MGFRVSTPASPAFALWMAVALMMMMMMTGVARANGRFPASVEVWPQPGRPDRFLVSNTFGLLIASDDGATVRWICEQALGYGGTFDPDYEVAADGTLYVATFDGLRVSRDDGCTWTPVAGPVAGRFFGAVDLAPDQTLYVATADVPPNDVYASRDGGRTFESAGLSTANGTFHSIEVAPSDAAVIYAAGFATPGVLLYATRDGGTSWQPLPIDDFALPDLALVFIEAVSPTDPDRVFARVRGGGARGGDALYRTINGGQSWTLVLDLDDDIRDVLVRRDGETVVVASVAEGPRLSSDGGRTFRASAQSLRMACAAETDDGTLLACAANYEPDRSAVAASRDGDSWRRVLQFERIDGPLKCAPGTVQFDVCEASVWPGLAEQLGVGTLEADAGPVAMDAGPGPPPTPSSGCCAVATGGRAAAGAEDETLVRGALALAGVAGLLICRRRRRWRRRRHR